MCAVRNGNFKLSWRQRPSCSSAKGGGFSLSITSNDIEIFCPHLAYPLAGYKVATVVEGYSHLLEQLNSSAGTILPGA